MQYLIFVLGNIVFAALDIKCNIIKVQVYIIK